MADMIHVYKVVRRDSTNNKFFNIRAENRTRGHMYKIFKERCRSEIRKHSFSCRVVDQWNKLPQ